MRSILALALTIVLSGCLGSQKPVPPDLGAPDIAASDQQHPGDVASEIATPAETTSPADLGASEVVDTSGETKAETAAPDTTRPFVKYFAPALAATVPFDAVIELEFSEPMIKLSVEKAFSLSGNGKVDGVFKWDTVGGSLGTKVTFTPNAPLKELTVHTLQISQDATDAAGNPLLPNFDPIWKNVFTTGRLPKAPVGDLIEPYMPSFVTLNQKSAKTSYISGYLLENNVTVELLVDGQPSGITTTAPQGDFQFTNGQLVQAGIAGLDPTVPDYTSKTVKIRVINGTGHADSEDQITYEKDTIAPQVTQVAPSGTVSVGSAFKITLSEPVYGVNQASVYIQSVSSNVVYDNDQIITLTPAAPLGALTSYKLYVTTSVTDLAGNPFAIDYIMSFQTQ